MNQKLNIVKIGGNVINDSQQLDKFLKLFAQIDGPKILVHGGGSLATTMEKELSLEPKMLNGRRITSRESLNVVVMVYAGSINKSITSKLQAMNNNAIGLSGADGNCILAKKRDSQPVDYGFAGDIVKINVPFIKSLLEQNMTPVFSAITHDGYGQLLNTNADTLASEIASALSAEFSVELSLVFEKQGVLGGDGNLLHTLSKVEFESLKTSKIIVDGMIPKLTNAFSALENGVDQIRLVSPEYFLEPDNTPCTNII